VDWPIRGETTWHRTQSSFVYFIAATRLNAVKVGVTNNLRKRLTSLQTGCPEELTLLASLPGNERHEKYVKDALMTHRIRGEWFRLNGATRELIQGFIDTWIQDGTDANCQAGVLHV
jgi:hypothetical protein